MSIPAIDLMTALRSGQSTSPRLTWYGPDSERVEFSGRVLDNWVAKTSNLLQDELDAEPGMRSGWTCRRTGSPSSSPWPLAAGNGGGPRRHRRRSPGHSRPAHGAAGGRLRRRHRRGACRPWRCAGRESCPPASWTTPPKSVPTATFSWPMTIRKRHGAPSVDTTAVHPWRTADGFAAAQDDRRSAAGSARRRTWSRAWRSHWAPGTRMAPWCWYIPTSR